MGCACGVDVCLISKAPFFGLQPLFSIGLECGNRLAFFLPANWTAILAVKRSSGRD